MQASDIQQMISTGLPQAQVEVTGADGVHFDALIVSDDFAGKATLARHRLVYATLGQAMGNEIHALALQTLTPEEYQSRTESTSEHNLG